jgi:hypothetical protein
MAKAEIQNHQEIFSIDRAKSKHDLKLVSSLMTVFPESSYKVILDSGYAVEALTGGIISRNHSDLDLMLVVSQSEDITGIKQKFINVVNTLDTVKWVPLPSKTSWIWLREISHETVPNPYQLNTHILFSSGKSEAEGIIINSGHPFFFPVEERILTDQDGTKTRVLCPGLEYMLAAKIRLIEAYGNDPRPKDLLDMKRMMSERRYSEPDCLRYLETFYVNRFLLSSEEAKEKASEQISMVKLKIQSNAETGRIFHHV